MQATVYPSTPNGTVSVPPSKSMAHRAIIMASLANGKSVIKNIQLSKDMQATIGAMQAQGAIITIEGSCLTVDGIGGGYRDEIATLDCAESGSTLRFLIPLCAATRKHTTFTGRGRLLDRPQSVYSKIFDKCGVQFTHNADEITVSGKLNSGEFTVQGDVSSQFVTGLLLVLPLLEGDSTVRIIPPFESRSYVELTLQTMADFGVNAHFSDDNTLQIAGGQRYTSANYTVEGDYSQLAFFAVLGAINGDIKAQNMRTNSLQGDKVIMKIIADFAQKLQTDDFHFKKAPLTARNIDLADCPDLGPILMVLASFAKGSTTIYNAGRLRIKESDRIASMELELTKLGVTITSTDDTVTIASRKEIGGKVTVQAHNDHRIAMSLAVFAACSNFNTEVLIEGAECVNKSYPDFFSDLAKVGVKILIIK